MHWIDPESLPEISGVLDRITVNPDGEPDGFVLADGTEVHVSRVVAWPEKGILDAQLGPNCDGRKW